MQNEVDRAIEAMQEATAAAHERTRALLQVAVDRSWSLLDTQQALRLATEEVGNQISHLAAITPIVTTDSLVAMIEEQDFETEENDQ